MVENLELFEEDFERFDFGNRGDKPINCWPIARVQKCRRHGDMTIRRPRFGVMTGLESRYASPNIPSWRETDTCAEINRLRPLRHAPVLGL